MRAALTLLALSATPALAETPLVVTDIAPVHSLVSQVMAGLETPTLLVDGPADLHSYQLRPSQARALQSADLVIWMGEEMTPWLARALENAERAEDIALLDHPLTDLREPEDDHDDHHDEDHADHDDEDHADHDHGDIDPHAWLSVDNARAWVGALAEELSARDPENADTYGSNAEAAIVELAQLDAAIAQRLAPFAGAEIVTFHDAYRYFTQSYEIDVAGSVYSQEGVAPSAAALDQLVDYVTDHDVTCGFAEPAYDPKLLDVLAEGSGMRIATIDAVGAALTAGPELYGQTLMAIADSIAECLTGATN